MVGAWEGPGTVFFLGVIQGIFVLFSFAGFFFLFFFDDRQHKKNIFKNKMTPTERGPFWAFFYLETLFGGSSVKTLK